VLLDHSQVLQTYLDNPKTQPGLTHYLDNPTTQPGLTDISRQSNITVNKGGLIELECLDMSVRSLLLAVMLDCLDMSVRPGCVVGLSRYVSKT
jgi:hypothetical protein